MTNTYVLYYHLKLVGSTLKLSDWKGEYQTKCQLCLCKKASVFLSLCKFFLDLCYVVFSLGVRVKENCRYCICHVTFSIRIGHENFELINHDVVEPLYIEGMYFDFPSGLFRGVFMKGKC